MLGFALASDGIWDVLETQEVSKYVCSYMSEMKEAKLCSEDLVTLAVKRWKEKPFNVGENLLDIDDITVIVAYVK